MLYVYVENKQEYLIHKNTHTGGKQKIKWKDMMQQISPKAYRLNANALFTESTPFSRESRG